MTLTLALSKGRIFEETLPLLARAGIAVLDDPQTSRKLILPTSRAGLRVVLVRASDVPTYVQHGGADLGVAGRDVLEVGCGSAPCSRWLATQGARVVGLDVSAAMLARGRRAVAAGASTAAPALVQAGAENLPFADASFDAVTMSFGLRNVVDVAGALAEFARVTKPGGRLLICEFSQPTNGPFRRIYNEYLMQALPPVARAVSSNPESYVYLAESIQAWPDQRALATRVAAAGWGEVEWRNLTGGIVALHRGVKQS